MSNEDDLSKIGSLGRGSSSEDKSNANLETLLEKERDARREDWFLFTLSFILLFDTIVFPLFNNWGSSISFLLLEVILLLIVARRFGVDEVAVWMDKILGTVIQRNSSAKK